MANLLPEPSNADVNARKDLGVPKTGCTSSWLLFFRLRALDFFVARGATTAALRLLVTNCNRFD